MNMMIKDTPPDQYQYQITMTFATSLFIVKCINPESCRIEAIQHSEMNSFLK